MDHEPIPQEGEDLVRFAAEANRQLHGQDDTTDGADPRRPGPAENKDQDANF
jgi:hypothetical protein